MGILRMRVVMDIMFVLLMEQITQIVFMIVLVFDSIVMTVMDLSCDELTVNIFIAQQT